MKKDKKRLDLLLVEKKLTATRSRARAEIMAGNVLVNGIKKDKPGEAISSQAKVKFSPHVTLMSAGRAKIRKALDEFAINLER